MRIATFNCNSVRRRIGTVLAWLEHYQPDLLALQETKCTDRDFPADAFMMAGWQVAFRGEKSYNGVAMVTRRPPDKVSFGLQDGDNGASETRFAHATIGGTHILNAYVPQGQDLESPKFQFKLEWLRRVKTYLASHFDADRDRVVWVGDLNVAPTPDDVHSPKTIWPHVCFCEAVAAEFAHVVDWGLVDIFRKHLPAPGNFTFWDYRVAHAVQRNMGWRIDHILATRAVAGRSAGCAVDTAPRRGENPSDHTFVYADFDL